MTSPIDPIHRPERARRGERRGTERRVISVEVSEDRSVPVVIEQIAAPKPEPARAPEGGSTFSAQLMGQAGQKRGLRGGPLVIDAAQGAYKSVEYSGPAERRARLGQITETEI